MARRALQLVSAVLAAACLALAVKGALAAASFLPTSHYVVRDIEGWTVRIHRDLLWRETVLGKAILERVRFELEEVRRRLPEAALGPLYRVPIWVERDSLLLADGNVARYHGSRRWLLKHDQNPDKARSVEISNARLYLRRYRPQYLLVLHELAHAYHDRVLGFGHPAIRAAYEQAKRSGRYRAVATASGKTRPHYGLTNVREYFAEGAEAYFGMNHFYPFNRDQLHEYDPRLFRLVRSLWQGRVTTAETTLPRLAAASASIPSTMTLSASTATPRTPLH